MAYQKPRVRVALDGTPSGPQPTGPNFYKLIPLIEDSAELSRSRSLGVPCVRERIEHFVGV